MKKIGKTMNPNSPYAKSAEIREATRKERVESSCPIQFGHKVMKS